MTDYSALFEALAKAQGEFAHAPKTSVNPHFKSRYADLAAILDVVRAPLAANGLAVMQEPVEMEGRLLLATTLVHKSGAERRSYMPVTVKDPGNPQSVGSAITYARRYALAAVLGVAADDDDGAAAAAAPEVYTAAHRNRAGTILKACVPEAAEWTDTQRMVLWEHVERSLNRNPPLMQNLEPVVKALAQEFLEENA